MTKFKTRCWICKRSKEEVHALLTDDSLDPEEYMTDSVGNWSIPVCIGCRDIIDNLIVESGVVLESELEERIQKLKITIE